MHWVRPFYFYVQYTSSLSWCKEYKVTWYIPSTVLQTSIAIQGRRFVIVKGFVLTSLCISKLVWRIHLSYKLSMHVSLPAFQDAKYSDQNTNFQRFRCKYWLTGKPENYLYSCFNPHLYPTNSVDFLSNIFSMMWCYSTMLEAGVTLLWREAIWMKQKPILWHQIIKKAMQCVLVA